MPAPPTTSPPGAASRIVIWLAAVPAVAAPTMLAWNVAPSSTFFNQALAFALWGWFVMACAWSHPVGRTAWRSAAPVLACLALLALAAALSFWPGSLPGTLALSTWATLAAAALVVLAGAVAAHADGSARHADTFAAFAFGVVVAALLGVLVAVIQVFAPDLADGDWIASSGIPGRAVGNLRQPNHLSSLLLWGCVAAVALLELQRWRLGVAAAASVLMVLAVVLTASRTGLLSVLLLALWGLLDRRLSRPARLLLLAAPLVYALCWQGMAWWGQLGEHRFGGSERLAETDISGSRFGIWANTLALIRAHPWFGVGWGEFNIAWSLTPFPQRPTAFFDHAHNLPLHLAAELGLPLATLVMALLLWPLVRVAHAAWRRLQPVDGPPGIALRCAFVFVLMIGLHSLLEYPLWYAYFLLPTAWAFGYALAAAQPAAAERSASGAPQQGSPGLLVAGALLVVGATLSVLDYARVSVIFSAPADAAPLAQRISAGQRSVFFGHHADYAAATTDIDAAPALEPFHRATHFLLDTRLMQAWAEALYQDGRLDEARHVVARLREFRNPAAAEFLAPCGSTPAAASAPPFQCQAPQRAVDWRELARSRPGP